MHLHILDDEKVTNRKILNIERIYPNKNVYVCIIENKDNIKYIDKNLPNLHLYSEGDTLNIDFSIFTKVIVSTFTISKIKFCNKYIKSQNIDCGFAGGDLYYLISCKGYKMISFDTLKLDTIMSLKFILSLVRYRLCYYPILVKFLREKVRSIYAIESDFMLLQKYISGLSHIKRLTWISYPLDQVLSSKMLGSRINASSMNILCGNSASFTNNHPYVFKYLKKLVNDSSQIIVPLSYTNALDRYIRKVKKMGNKLFGDKFIPLTEFIPLESYNNILLSSSIAVFGHWRQEAMGNIVPLLYLGTKIYLSMNNPLLQELKNKGYYVFALEEATPITFYEKMSERMMVHNRDLAFYLNNTNALIS